MLRLPAQIQVLDVILLGLVFDNQGDPISNAEVAVIYPNSTEKIYYTNSSGYFSFFGEIPKKIVVTFDGQQKFILVTYFSYLAVQPGGIEKITIYNFPFSNVSCFYNYFGCGMIVRYNGYTAKLIPLSSNTTFCFYKTYAPVINGSLLNITILQPLKVTTVTIPKGTLAVIGKHSYRNKYGGGSFASGSYFATVSPIEIKFLKHEGIIPFPIFSFILGIAFTYVTYKKLKEGNSKLTRGLYLTSYFSGILALIISTSIFSLATSSVFFTYTGIFPTYDIVVLFAFVFLSVIIWYSLSYLLFSRFSPAVGLTLSIFLLVMFLLSSASLLVQISPIKPLYYFLPTSLVYSILYHSIYFSYPINPEISLVVEVLWITIPTATGYLISKRDNV